MLKINIYSSMPLTFQIYYCSKHGNKLFTLMNFNIIESFIRSFWIKLWDREKQLSI